MSVKIRLTRVGRKKTPQFRIVVMDSRDRRDGAYIDQLGLYHPSQNPIKILIEEEKALRWLGNGALPSETVKSLFTRQGIMLRHDLVKRGTAPDQIDREMAEWSARNKEREQNRSAKKRSKKRAKAEKATAS